VKKPSFLITIDTEGDNLWVRPRKITTNNSRYLPRFQALCERYSLTPTWLTDYEMAECPIYREFAADYLKRGVGELGMHLHAWNSPPIESLTDDDWYHQPYLIEYPERIIVKKIDFMTDLLESRFGIKPVSHRAGRWALDKRYAHHLRQRGYRVDTSVTPFTSWKGHQGDPKGNGGTDYRGFPHQPYRLDVDHIDRSGHSNLLEIPVTIVRGVTYGMKDKLPSMASRVVNRVCPYVHWLRPNGQNLNRMVGILKQASWENWSCVTFMLHSSELMPGGSPIFKDELAIEKLYEDLEALFEFAQDRYEGHSLSAFNELWLAEHPR